MSKELKRKCPSALLGTRLYNFQPATPTLRLSAAMHSVTHGRTDRRQYHANSRSYCSAKSA